MGLLVLAATTSTAALALLPARRLARPGLLVALRGAWHRQEALQQRYADRVELSGREALAAGRTLRLGGDRLAGDVLPPA